MMPKIVDTVSLANTEMSIPDENILPEYTSSINIILPNELKPLVIEGFEVFCLDEDTETQVQVIDIEDGENEVSEILEDAKPKLSLSSSALKKKPLSNDSKNLPVIVDLDDDDDDDDVVVICEASTPKLQVAQLNENSTQVTIPMSTHASEITKSSAIKNNNIDIKKKPKKEKLDNIIKSEEFEICPEEQALKKEHLDLSKFSIKERIRQSYIKIVRITCPVCKMMLEDSHVSDEILKHFKIHVGYFPYGCTLCDFVSADTIEVQQHSEKNHRRKLVKMIPESDTQKQEYETILRQVRKGDGVKEYFACKKCSCEFRKLDAYQRHIKVHSKILCPYCNFSCNKKRELTKHFDQFHQHLNSIKVLDLPKSQNNSDVSDDEKSGENIPSNKNNDLQDVEPQLQLPLKFHSIKKESKPTEPPPLVCPSCKKQFVVVKTALRHLRYHASYYPYKCAYCRYIAMERPMVVDHLRRRHHEEITKIILHKNMEKEKKVYTELVSKMTKITAQIYDIENYLSGNDSDNFDDEDNDDQSKNSVKRSFDTADLTEESQKQINGFPKKRRKYLNNAANSLSNPGSYKLVSNPGQSLKIIFKKETHNSKGKNSEMSGDPNLKHPFLLACKVCGYATYVADLYREHIKIHKNFENSNLERDDPHLLHCDDCDFATYVEDLHNEHIEGHNVSKTLNLVVGSATLKEKAFSMLKNIETQSSTLSALFRNCSTEIKKMDAKSDSEHSSINVGTSKNACEIELKGINDCKNFDLSEPSTSDNQQGDNIKICRDCKKLASPSHFYFHTQTKLSLLPFKCLYCKFRYSTHKVVSSHIASKHKDHPICVTYERTNTHSKYNQSGTVLTCFCVYCNFSNDNRDSIREHIKQNHKNKPVRVKVCKTVPLQTSGSTKDIMNSDDKDIHKTESQNNVSHNSQSSDIFQDQEVTVLNGFDSETPSESESKKIEPLRIRKISPEFAFVKNTNAFLNDSIAFTDNPTVKCQLCKQLVQSKLVKQHLRKHFGIMRFQCKYCSFSGLFRFSVHQHILIKHSGFRINVVDNNSAELEFKEKLMKEFIEESMLCINSSAENIDEILLFQCPACPFNSSSKHVWFDHKKIHFNAMTMYCCAYCDISFSETSKARSHCRTVHIPKLLKIIELTEIKAVLGNNPKYCRFRTLFAKGIPRTIRDWNPFVKMSKIKSTVFKGKS